MGLPHINWSKVAHYGLEAITVILTQVGLIERLGKALPTLKGQDKENAAVELTKMALQDADLIVGKDLLGDKEVEAATREFIRAYVALQNLIASRKH